VSQALTLYTTPVIYLAFDRLARGFGGRRVARRGRRSSRTGAGMSSVFITRPVATTLLTIGLVLAGLLAFRLLPVAALPQVDFPTIQVSASLPGASPETMATSVAAPLERQFGRIAGVTEMTSTSYLGSTTIILQFDISRDIDGAARDVRPRSVARGYPRHPGEPHLPQGESRRRADLIFALTSDTLRTGELYDLASSILQQKLSRVEGVGQVFVGGSSLPAVRVDLDPQSLSRYGIGLEDVRATLTATNVRRPKGQLAEGGRSWEIDTNDQLTRADQYRPLVIAYHDGAALQLKDVATVTDSVEDIRAAGFLNGKPAVLVILFRSPNANIIDTVDRVREVVPQLRASLPGMVDLSIVLTTPRSAARC
jgi:multidrug efflux pump